MNVDRSLNSIIAKFIGNFINLCQFYWYIHKAPLFFFLSEFSFTDTDDSQDSRGR